MPRESGCLRLPGDPGVGSRRRDDVDPSHLSALHARLRPHDRAHRGGTAGEARERLLRRPHPRREDGRRVHGRLPPLLVRDEGLRPRGPDRFQGADEEGSGVRSQRLHEPRQQALRRPLPRLRAGLQLLDRRGRRHDADGRDHRPDGLHRRGLFGTRGAGRAGPGRDDEGLSGRHRQRQERRRLPRQPGALQGGAGIGRDRFLDRLAFLHPQRPDRHSGGRAGGERRRPLHQSRRFAALRERRVGAGGRSPDRRRGQHDRLRLSGAERPRRDAAGGFLPGGLLRIRDRQRGQCRRPRRRPAPAERGADLGWPEPVLRESGLRLDDSHQRSRRSEQRAEPDEGGHGGRGDPQAAVQGPGGPLQLRCPGQHPGGREDPDGRPGRGDDGRLPRQLQDRDRQERQHCRQPLQGQRRQHHDRRCSSSPAPPSIPTR